MTMILCARVSWPVPAIRTTLGWNAQWKPTYVWTCSWCGARVKVVA